MNWMDWLLIAFFVASIANGFQEGLVRMGIGMMALIAGFFLASWFGGMAGGWVMSYVHAKPLALIIGYLMVFIGVLLVGTLIGALIARMLKLVGLSWMDRILGGAFGVVRGFVVVTVVAMVVTAFAPSWMPKAVNNSTLAPYVLGSARVLSAATPFEIRDRFDRAYKDLRDLWTAATQKRKRVETRVE
jgi:membrane protein required for colicin V production